MIAHTGVPVRNVQAAKQFYQRVLAPLGYRAKIEAESSVVFDDGSNGDFWVGEADTIEPTHVAFRARSKAQVDEFYDVALAAGGRDNGGPGYRPRYSPGYYAAFVYDLDGHNIEAVWFDDAPNATPTE